jgi:phage-related minor tail protein
VSNPGVVVRLTIDGKEFVGGVADAQKRLDALGKTGAISAGQTAAAWRTVPAQFTDIATQLQGGASPLTVLLQQGGQLKDSFGGIGPMFRQLATLITPVGVAVGAVAAVVGSFGLAAMQGQQEAAALARSLQLTGNFAGMASGQFSGMARDVAATSGASIGSTRELLQALVSTGEVGPQAIGAVTAAAARLAKVSGATAQDVAQDFAGMARNVTAWAVEHNRQYNFLTKAEYDQVKALQDHGRAQEAMVLVADKLDKALKDRQPELSALGKLWDELGNKASAAWSAMKGIGVADTTQDKLAKAAKELAGFDANMPQAAGGMVSEERLAAIRARRQALAQSMFDLMRQADREGTNTLAAADKLAKEKQKIEDDASGKAAALANAGIDARLARERSASALQLAAIAGDQQRLDAIYKSGLASAATYTSERIALINRDADAQADKVRAEIAAESARPADTEVARAQKTSKLIALQGQLQQVQIDAVRRVTQAQIEGDQAALESARARAQAWADTWKAAQDQVRGLQDANADRAIGLIQDPAAQAQARAARANALAQRQLATSLIDPTNQRDIAQAGGDTARASLMQQQIDALGKATADSIELNNKELGEKLKPQWQKNLDAWRDNNRLMAESWDELMNGVQRNAEDAFVQFATTGKLSVKGLVQDALAQLARLQFRQFAGGMQDGGGGLLGSLLGSAGSLLGGLFGGGRATGGPVSAGGMYLVGESGPELLRMGPMGGSVIPGQSMGRMLAAAGAAVAGTTVALSLPTSIQIDARSDQAQVLQAVTAGMAASEKRIWAALRARGLA